MNLIVPELVKGQGIFLSARMNPPPAEKLPHVLQLELTTGCSHNKCTFCTMYRGEEFGVKSKAQFKEHVDKVWDNLNRSDPKKVKDLERIFIGSGDALVAPTETLRFAIDYSIKTFRDNVGELPRRVAMYGNTADIVKKIRSLNTLNCGGTCGNCSIDRFGSKIGLGYIYWGIESGCDEILEMTHSGYTKEEINHAASNINLSGIKTSVTVIPGLGGKKFSDNHVYETVDVLNRLRPNFITFIGLIEGKNAPYTKIMDSQKDNRRLNPNEITEQTAQMIENLNIRTIIGVHGSDIHTFGYNPVSIGSRRIDGMYDARNIALELREKIKRN